MYPFVVLLVVHVNTSVGVNRVNTVEDNGKGGAAPDISDEEGNVQRGAPDIEVYVDRDHLQSYCRLCKKIGISEF